MADRGSYRSTYETLADDLDFQALSFGAQAVFHSLKLKLGQYGIGVFYHQVLYSLHKRQTPDEIDAALVELEQPKPGRPPGWIKREAHMVWLVNALRHEPSVTLSNANHRTGALKFAKALPQLALVREFMAYYGLTDEAPTAPPIPAPSLPPSHPHPLPDASGIPGGITETETEREQETDTESETERDLDRERAGAPPHTSAPDLARDSLASARGENGPRDASASPAPPPPATRASPLRTPRPPHPPTVEDLKQLPGVRAYLSAHFGAVQGRKLPPIAKRALAELLATLGPGAKLERDRVVRAVDLAHVSGVCAVVSRMHLNVPTSANRVVLKKLEESATEVRRLREREAAEEAEGEGNDLLTVAAEWLEEHPDIRAAVERAVETHSPKAKADITRVGALMRQQLFNAKVIEAFRASMGEVAAPAWLPEPAVAA